MWRERGGRLTARWSRPCARMLSWTRSSSRSTSRNADPRLDPSTSRLPLDLPLTPPGRISSGQGALQGTSSGLPCGFVGGPAANLFNDCGLASAHPRLSLGGAYRRWLSWAGGGNSPEPAFGSLEAMAGQAAFLKEAADGAAAGEGGRVALGLLTILYEGRAYARPGAARALDRAGSRPPLLLSRSGPVVSGQARGEERAAGARRPRAGSSVGPRRSRRLRARQGVLPARAALPRLHVAHAPAGRDGSCRGARARVC